MCNLQFCSRCDGEFTEENLTGFDNEFLCSPCLDNLTSICFHCDDRLWADDNAGTNDRPLCQHCYDNYFVRCNDCGAIVHNDDICSLDDDNYCSGCYNDRSEDSFDYINEYNYKPSVLFYGEGIYYGIELEIDEGGLYDNNAYKILSIANKDCNYLYCKKDGSLNDGFELVSHALTLEKHQNCMDWKGVLDKAISLGYRSHEAGTCGLHIHTNRTALGDSYDEQEATIAKILYFVERFWEQVLRASRRTTEQMNRWSARYGLKENPKDQIEYAKTTPLGRYACINLQNQHTVEFRMFRGTLKYKTFLATLQFVDEIVNVAIDLSADEMQRLSWGDFTVGIRRDEKPELINYLKQRQLLNEETVSIIESDGEI